MMYNINKQRIDDIDSLPNLVLRAEMLSNEGIGDVFKNITNIFTSKVSSIANYFTTKNKDLKEINITARPLTKLTKVVNNISKRIEYSTYKDYEVGSVMGLRTYLLDASTLIEACLVDSNKKLLPSLDALDTLISKVISDKDYILSLRADAMPDISSYLLSDNLDKIIDPNDRNDQFKLGKLYPNVKSIYDTQNELLKVNHLINKNDLEQISATIDKISSKVDTLKEQVDSGIITKASKNVLLGLANALESNAAYITNIVAIYHVLNIINGTHIKSVDILKRIM